MSYLKRFPVDKLKLDISFVREITTDAGSLAISEAIITMAHNLRLRVVAEGVETETQLALLIARGCDEMQGYFFSRPLLPDDLAKLLREGRGLSPRLLHGVSASPALLVVDDDPDVLDLIRRILVRNEFRMLFAHSAAEGLEMLAQHEIGVVLCDQRMPNMTGVEFLTKVRTMYPNTVRMLMSEYEDVAATREAINLGAVYKFVVKSRAGDELVGSMKDAFRQYRKTGHASRGVV